MVDKQLKTPGDVLRRWRESQNFTLDAIGRAMPAPDGPVGSSTVSQWETGKRSTGLATTQVRGPSAQQVRAIDDRLGADGTFSAMYSAARTPEALQSDTDWWKNFQGPSGPCWAWVRTSAPTPVAGVADAGPFRLEFEVPPGDGIFVQAYGFASNPAVHIELTSPGWADFGPGKVPPGLGVPILDAVNLAVMGPRAERDPALAAAPHGLFDKKFGLTPGWFERFKAKAGHRVEVARTLLTRSIRVTMSATTDLSTAPVLGTDAAARWSGEQYRNLREARGLFRQDAAEMANTYTWKYAIDPPLAEVSEHHVRRLEEGAIPRVDQLAERLDMVYSVDGRSCLAEVMSTSGAGCFDVCFPVYWIGPVWIAFIRTSLAGAPATAELRWSPWRKPLTLTHDVVVSCRRATAEIDQLVITVPQGWRMTAGVGVHPYAVDVNEGWGFFDPARAREALAHYYDVMLQALQK